ncbi:MAG: glutamate synthase large subunit, partial [Gammaproteobacteria bacterium]
MTLPLAKSLWSERFERDSCGFGLIAHLEGRGSHELVQTAVQALVRLTHRGAVAADGRTGDGCGLLMAAPTRFLEKIAGDAGLTTGELFAAGLVFLNPSVEGAARARRRLDEMMAREGLLPAGWRPVPIDESACGDQALRSLPRIEHVFVSAPEGMAPAEFDRRLFVARRRAEMSLEDRDPVFYVGSLSHSTLLW